MSIEELRIDRERPGSGNGRTLAWVVLLALIAAALFLWWRHANAAPLVGATIAIPSTGGALETVLNASGYVTARRQATVSSKVTGQITEVLFEEGQKAQ